MLAKHHIMQCLSYSKGRFINRRNCIDRIRADGAADADTDFGDIIREGTYYVKIPVCAYIFVGPVAVNLRVLQLTIYVFLGRVVWPERKKKWKKSN